MSYRVVNGTVHPVEPPGGYSTSLKNNEIKVSKKESFSNILDEKIKSSSFEFSSHAKARMEARNISFNEKDINIINEGINKAEKKGCRESVIFYKDNALITSIKNRTVITVVDKNNIKGNIFTNVDSVVTL